MNASEYLVLLAPELIMLVGACVTLFAGVLKVGEGRSATPLLSLVTLVAALGATMALGRPGGDFAGLGLWLTPMVYFARLITLLVGVVILLVNWHQPADRERGEYFSMILFSLLGLMLTAAANDVVVLFFAIELVSVPTYVLIGLSRKDVRASESAVKYFFLGALSAALLAYGLALLYGVAGTTTLSMVEDARLTGGIASFLAQPRGLSSGLAVAGLLLSFAGLAFKIAAVPFHVYAPDVYEGAAAPVTGMLGFVPKFAGFLALIKIFAACQWQLPTELLWMIWAVAALTMTVGNVLALLQTNVKRMLAYSSIAHTGYMLIAILVGPAMGVGPMHNGVTALLFYISVYGLMNLGAFSLLAAFRIGDRAVETLDDLAGMSARGPRASFAMAICAFSLMGFPPTAGMLGKVYIFASAFSLPGAHVFASPLVALAIIGVVNSAIAAAYYLRIVGAIYIAKPADDAPPIKSVAGAPLGLGLAVCAVTMLVLFAWPTPLSGRAWDASMNAPGVTMHATADADRVQVCANEQDDDADTQS